jgi:hypothetical protein
MLRPLTIIALSLTVSGCAAPVIDMTPPPGHPAHAGSASGQSPLRSRALAQPAATPALGTEVDDRANDEPAGTPSGHEHHGGHE